MTQFPPNFGEWVASWWTPQHQAAQAAQQAARQNLLTQSPAPATNLFDQSARAILEGALAEFGLQSLATWAWNRHVLGNPIEQIFLDLRNTPEYKARFPAMEKLSRDGRAITERQYIDFERGAVQLWHNAGLPAEQIEEGAFVQKWLEADVSLNELSHRVMDLFVRVSQTAPEVRSWYSEQFGYEGDAAIAASFADPESAVPVLERRAAASEFGGAGSRFGFQIGLSRAMEAAGVGVTGAQAQQGFAQLDQLSPLFDESVSERENLTAEGEGVGAVFGLDAGASRVVQRRQRGREAAFAGSGQAGGLQTDRGLGVGRAKGNQ